MLSTNLVTTSPNATPALLNLRPTFLAPEKASAQDALDMAVEEAREAVWLQAIDNLTKETLSIQSEAALTGFKAILILQAHQLFYLRHQWFSPYHDFIYKNILLKIIIKANGPLGMTLANADESLNKITDPQELKEAIEKLVDPAMTDFYNQLTTLLQLENTLLLPGDTSLPSATALAKITEANKTHIVNHFMKVRQAKSFNEIMQTAFNVDITHITEKANIAFREHAFTTTVIEGANRFNAERMANIAELKKQNCEQLIDQSPFKQYKKELLKHRKRYIDFHEAYLALFQNTLENIQRWLPELTPETFTGIYQKAFEVFTRPENRSVFATNFLYELFLQQGRKPYLQTALHDTLTTKYIPGYNAIFADTPIRLPQIAAYANKYIPASLHQIIEKAFVALHPQSSIANHSPPLITGGNAELKSDNTAVIPSSSSTQLMLQTISKPLFTETAPGTLTTASVAVIKTKAERAEHFANAVFQPFSKNTRSDGKKSRPDQDVDDRIESVRYFNRTLEDLTTLEDIAALVAAAKPYINRHRNELWDKIFGIDNVYTWLLAFDRARHKFMETFKHLASTENVDTMINTWCSQPIVADKYKLSFFAFTKNAEDDLNKLQRELKSVVSRPQNG